MKLNDFKSNLIKMFTIFSYFLLRKLMNKPSKPRFAVISILIDNTPTIVCYRHCKNNLEKNFNILKCIYYLNTFKEFNLDN